MKILDFLKCPSCGKSLIKAENYYECQECKNKYPIIREIPILVKSPTDYLLDLKEKLENEYEKDIRPAESDHPNITSIHKNRIETILKEIELYLPGRTQSSKSNVSIRRYTETYLKEMNNDQYILSAYAPFLKDVIAYSECLYSTAVNLGSSIPSNGSMLEIGCGVGRTLLDYSYLLKEGNVIGVDLEYSKVRLAYNILKTNENIECVRTKNFGYEKFTIKGFNRKNIYLIVADANNLPFKNKVFDIVIIIYLLGLLEEPEKFLKTIPNLLKDKGVLIIADDHGWYERFRPKKTQTCPSMLDEALKSEGLVKEIEFDTPYFEILTDRCYHLHLTRFVKYRKKVT
jgi:SAM-dependent methyltransferase/uncharacterized protein YbaR (Trm112 family)